jgi:hypothetical protein
MACCDIEPAVAVEISNRYGSRRASGRAERLLSPKIPFAIIEVHYARAAIAARDNQIFEPVAIQIAGENGRRGLRRERLAPKMRLPVIETNISRSGPVGDRDIWKFVAIQIS